MAKQKKPENETAEEAEIRHTKETISNNATRNEKISWDRKMDNMIVLLARLRPIEDQITDLTAQKMVVIDEVNVLRTEMVDSCVHPYTHLTHHDGYVACKFCNRKFTVLIK